MKKELKATGPFQKPSLHSKYKPRKNQIWWFIFITTTTSVFIVNRIPLMHVSSTTKISHVEIHTVHIAVVGVKKPHQSHTGMNGLEKGIA